VQLLALAFEFDAYAVFDSIATAQVREAALEELLVARSAPGPQSQRAFPSLGTQDHAHLHARINGRDGHDDARRWSGSDGALGGRRIRFSEAQGDAFAGYANRSHGVPSALRALS
jgi:hypothetical protein